MPRKEELNVQYLKRRVKETGGETRKVKWVNRRGAPDQLVGWKSLGRYTFVEVKEEEQPWGLQDHQRREIEWMKSIGLRVAILSTKAEIDEFIKRMMDDEFHWEEAKAAVRKDMGGE